MPNANDPASQEAIDNFCTLHGYRVECEKSTNKGVVYRYWVLFAGKRRISRIPRNAPIKQWVATHERDKARSVFVPARPVGKSTFSHQQLQAIQALARGVAAWPGPVVYTLDFETLEARVLAHDQSTVPDATGGARLRTPDGHAVHRERGLRVAPDRSRERAPRSAHGIDKGPPGRGDDEL